MDTEKINDRIREIHLRSRKILDLVAQQELCMEYLKILESEQRVYCHLGPSLGFMLPDYIRPELVRHFRKQVESVLDDMEKLDNAGPL